MSATRQLDSEQPEARSSYRIPKRAPEIHPHRSEADSGALLGGVPPSRTESHELSIPEPG